MSCNCEGKNYNISMGCCEPVLAPIENYYTKYQIDKMIASAVTSGCCITPEEVDEKIEEAISGITVSGVTEEELNNAIASAKTEIEAEMPTVPTSNTAFTNDAGYLTEHQSLSGYATEQWVLDKNYITGVDLSNYATKDEIPTVPTKVSAFENDVPYLTEHQSLSGYVTDTEMSAYTYDKQTIDDKIAQGGTFDPSQYYNTAQTNSLIESAVTRVEGEIPSLSGYATEQWVLDKNYITGVDLSNYATKAEIPTVPTSNTAFTNDAGYLTEHQSLSGYVTDVEMSAFTYDKATIDEKVAEGGTFDPTQYYNKTATNALLDEKLDVTAYTPTDLSNYYNKQEVNNIVESAKTEVEAEIPTVPTSNTAFTNDAGYLTEHQSLDNYYNKTQTDNLLDEKQNTLSAGTGINITNNVISATGGGGESCTVNDKVIVKTYDSLYEANITSVYVCYSGRTYGQYYYLLIDGISSWLNGEINFSTGGHTGNTSGWEDYYTVAWDSANARFLFTAKGNYKINQINNTALYFQVPLYTISGTSCDAAETLADALNDTIADVLENSIAIENKVDYTTLNNYLLKSKIWCGTESEYNSIVNKDSETLYLIHE